jgi:hypothetical protein
MVLEPFATIVRSLGEGPARGGGQEDLGVAAMLRKRKESKRKSIALILMRDLQGSAAQKLAMFEKVRAAGGFAKESDLAEAERMLREFAAIEKGTG